MHALIRFSMAGSIRCRVSHVTTPASPHMRIRVQERISEPQRLYLPIKGYNLRGYGWRVGMGCRDARQELEHIGTASLDRANHPHSGTLDASPRANRLVLNT